MNNQKIAKRIYKIRNDSTFFSSVSKRYWGWRDSNNNGVMLNNIFLQEHLFNPDSGSKLF